LTGATWSQGAEEADQLAGKVTMFISNRPGSRRRCAAGPNEGVETAPGTATIVVRLDGSMIGHARLGDISSPVGRLETSRIRLEPESGGGPELFEPGQATNHTLSVTASDNCGTGGGTSSGHLTINSVAIDVIGVR
jgi:hypothetical protein